MIPNILFRKVDMGNIGLRRIFMRGIYSKLIRLLIITVILSFALSTPNVIYGAQEGFWCWINVFKDNMLSPLATDYTGDAKIEDGRIIIRESGKGYSLEGDPTWTFGPGNSRGNVGESESRAGSDLGKNIAGLWIHHAGNDVAELRFQGPNSQLQGTIKFLGGDVEKLTEISYDGETLRFTRPIADKRFRPQLYTGTLTRTAKGELLLEGQYTTALKGYKPSQYDWYAIKQK
jgi:hypothetical protein